jgi:hypothetical protein
MLRCDSLAEVIMTKSPLPSQFNVPDEDIANIPSRSIPPVMQQTESDPPPERPIQLDSAPAAPPFFQDQNELLSNKAAQQNRRNFATIVTGPVEPPYAPVEGAGEAASDAADTLNKTEPLPGAVPSNIVTAQESPAELAAGRAVVHSSVIATEAVTPEIQSVPETESAPQADVSIPRQVVTASQFSINETTGRIDLVPDSPDLAMLADPSQRIFMRRCVTRHSRCLLSAATNSVTFPDRAISF